MPIYEHECIECKKISEEIYGINENKCVQCKYCGKETVRIISSTTFRLLGSGWTINRKGS